MLSLIHQELQREQQGSGAVLTALSQVLLAMGLRAHASDPHGALGLVGALQDPRLGRSLQAMLADPAHPWSVDELAALAAMSRATYFRHFRQRLGCSVWEFMVRVRMVRAAELLAPPGSTPPRRGGAAGRLSVRPPLPRHSSSRAGWRLAAFASRAGLSCPASGL